MKKIGLSAHELEGLFRIYVKFIMRGGKEKQLEGRELPFGEASGRCVEKEEERGRVGEKKDTQRDMERKE